jgi:phosphoribosyl-ATP pyrophosphohydrolase
MLDAFAIASFRLGLVASRELQMASDTLLKLAEMIHGRRQASGENSYTRQLLDGGPEKCARKFGEEALEVVIAGVSSDAAAVKAEAADVLYHLLVLLEIRGIPLADVYALLDSRMGMSGIDEKASRARTA